MLGKSKSLPNYSNRMFEMISYSLFHTLEGLVSASLHAHHWLISRGTATNWLL